MHPFYGPSARLLGERATSVAGLVSMAAYLAFWAGALVVAKRELDARFPRVPPDVGSDPAMRLLRERYARGEIDAVQFAEMCEVLAGEPRGPA